VLCPALGSSVRETWTYGRKPNKEPQRCLSDTVAQGQREIWDWSPGEGKAQGDLIHVYKNTLWEGMKKSEPDSSPRCPEKGKMQRAQTETREIPSEHTKSLFHCKAGQTPAQAGRGCGVSACADTQAQAVRGPAQPAPADAAWAGVGLETSRDSSSLSCSVIP